MFTRKCFYGLDQFRCMAQLSRHHPIGLRQQNYFKAIYTKFCCQQKINYNGGNKKEENLKTFQEFSNFFLKIY